MKGREDRNRQETQERGYNTMQSYLLLSMPATLVATERTWGAMGLPVKHYEGKVHLLHHARRSFRVSINSGLLVVYSGAERSGTNWACQPAQSKNGSARTHVRLNHAQSNPIQFHKFSPIP
jgi:hypothetical protein